MGKMKNADSAKTRQKIINTATVLIMKKGPDQTSLSEIAREAGISKGTLYYYYPTKSALIFEITKRHMQQVTEDILEWIGHIEGDLPPSHILKAVYRTMLKAERRGKLHLYLIQDAIHGDSEFTEMVRDVYIEWKGKVKEGLSQMVKDHPDKDILAELILSCLDGIIIQSSLGIKNIPIDRMTEYILR